MANSRPVAINDILPFMEFDVISGNLLANDTGPARFLRFLGDDRVEAKRGPDQITAIAGDHGTFFVKPDGSFTYELDPEVAASIGPGQMVIEQLQYKVSDGMGRTDVGILRLEISGAGAGTEVRTIDFEDLEPGTIVPDGYQGFDWGDGWTIETDDVGESGAGNHVAKPVQAVDSIRLVGGADFDVFEIVLNCEMDGPLQTMEIRGFNDGVPHPFYRATIGLSHPEPASIPMTWEGIDELQITHDPGIWIDEIFVVVPAV